MRDLAISRYGWMGRAHTPVVQDRQILNLRDLAISRYGGMDRLIPNGSRRGYKPRLRENYGG